VLPVLLSQAGHATLEGVLSYIAPSADSMAAAYKADLDRTYRTACAACIDSVLLVPEIVLLLSQAGHVTLEGVLSYISSRQLTAWQASDVC
jgi:hypothetical protein